MFTVNLCHFHIVHQEQKPQHCAQLLANPLQPPLTPCNTHKVSKIYNVTAIITLTSTKATEFQKCTWRDCHQSSVLSRCPKVLYYHAKHESILAVTFHLNRNQNSIFNATVPCPRTAPTEHGTITKHNLQRIHARPYPQKKDVASIAFKASLQSLEAPTQQFFCRRCS